MGYPRPSHRPRTFGSCSKRSREWEGDPPHTEDLVERLKDSLKQLKKEMKNATDPAVKRALADQLNELRKEREGMMVDMGKLDLSKFKRTLKFLRMQR